MNEIRKLMETLNRIGEESPHEEAGVLTFNAGGVRIKISYNDKEVFLNHGHGQNIFLSQKEWELFVDGIIQEAGLFEEQDVFSGIDLDEDDKSFNKHGFRTLFEKLPITGVEGDIFKVTAVDYDASVPTNTAEVDGVMIGWYDYDQGESTYAY